MNLVDKIEKAKQFNDTDIVAAFKAIKSLVKTDDWVYGNAFKFSNDYKKEYPPYYLNLEDLTDGTLEQIIKQNKGYNTIIIGARRKINKLGDFVKLELQVTPKRVPVIVVQIVFLLGDNGKEKIFKVSDYKSAIKYANKINV